MHNCVVIRGTQPGAASCRCRGAPSPNAPPGTAPAWNPSQGRQALTWKQLLRGQPAGLKEPGNCPGASSPATPPQPAPGNPWMRNENNSISQASHATRDPVYPTAPMQGTGRRACCLTGLQLSFSAYEAKREIECLQVFCDLWPSFRLFPSPARQVWVPWPPHGLAVQSQRPPATALALPALGAQRPVKSPTMPGHGHMPGQQPHARTQGQSQPLMPRNASCSGLLPASTAPALNHPQQGAGAASPPQDPPWGSPPPAPGTFLIRLDTHTPRSSRGAGPRTGWQSPSHLDFSLLSAHD